MLSRSTARLFIVIMSAALLCAGCEQSEKTIVLRYKYTPNQKLVYKQDMQRHTRLMAGDSLVEKSSNTFVVDVVQEVTEVRPDSTAVIKETDTWSYTHPSKADSMVLDTVMVETSMLVTMRPDGDILDVEFLDESSETRRQYIKNFMEQGMPVFPSGEISPGFSWTQTSKVIMPEQTMEASSTYRFVNLVREAGYDCALLEVDGNLVIPVTSSAKDSIQSSGIDRIQTTGTMYFAYREGMVVLQKERWVIVGDRTQKSPKETKKYQLQMESDVNYALTDRTLAQ